MSTSSGIEGILHEDMSDSVALPAPALIGPTPPPGPFAADSHEPAWDHRRSRFWSIALRIVILLTLISGTWLGVLSVPPAGAAATIATLAAYVAFLAAGPRRFPLLGRADLILTLDLLVITALLVLSGSLGSPFVYLYYLAILEAAVTLDLRQAVAAAIATAGLLVLLWTSSGHAATFATQGFYLGAVIAGGFLIALVLGMVVHESRASAQQVQWNNELDRRLRDATRELEARVDELETYNNLARHLSGELRVDGVMEIVLEAFGEITGAPQGAAYVVAEDGGLRLSATRGVLPRDENGAVETPPLPEGPEGGEMHVLPHGPAAAPSGWWCCTPLVRQGQVRAWLTGFGDAPPALTDAARGRIRGLATQSVIAVEAARLHEEVQRMIRTDPMRALCPWATFEQLVRDEIERCRSLLLVFSIAEIQLEDYAGNRADAQDRDLALRRAVKLFQAPLRRVDVLSYDGAGRFAVLLPRVPKVRALEMMQELVSRLERDDVATRLLMVERLALTAGVVSFPEDGTTPSDLTAGVEALLVLGPTAPARVQMPAT